MLGQKDASCTRVNPTALHISALPALSDLFPEHCACEDNATQHEYTEERLGTDGGDMLRAGGAAWDAVCITTETPPRPSAVSLTGSQSPRQRRARNFHACGGHEVQGL